MLTTDIEIDAELQAWIPALSADELGGLEASILAEGCRDPLVVWGGYLLDGHNRYAICKQHGIAFQTFEKTGLRTKADAKIWMIENQLAKRNTNDFVRVALALKLKPLIEERAQQRMLAGKAAPSPKSDEGIARTDQAIATAAGVGKGTVRNVEKIIAHATPDVIARAQSGEMSINKAAQTVAPPKSAKKSAVADQEAPPLPKSPPVVADLAPAAAPAIPPGMILVDAEEYEQIIADAKHTLADNEMMGRVFDADDRMATLMAEVKRQAAIADTAERSLFARSGEFVERARAVSYWMKRAQKAEKALARLSPAA